MRHKVLVFSSLFPSAAAPGNGLFIRERLFRVAAHAEVTVVAPVPWFPGQGLLRLFRKNYRPQPAKQEVQQGITVYYPRFFALPGLLRNLDATMMYLCCLPLVRRLQRERGFGIIDSHFTYPDGLAATRLARRLGLKSIITLRGTESSHSQLPGRTAQLLEAWSQADRLFCVSDSLRQLAIGLGADTNKLIVIGNGIDTDKFHAIDKGEARMALGIDVDARVLITVGGLVERKGFHRVLACLPRLIKEHPQLVYLIVGGSNAEGDYKPQIEALAAELGITGHVRFLGALKPEELSLPLSAADAFILASSNEGWANVILEAMACGTPVIATDVGGNAEVVNAPGLGIIVPFGDPDALAKAIQQALRQTWDTAALTNYASENHWDRRITQILLEYDRLLA